MNGDEPLARRVTAVDDLASVRQLVHRLAERAGIAPDRATRLVVAVNEAVTNAIQHAGGRADVIIDRGIDGHELVVHVHDGGPGIPDGTRARPAPDSPRGRGLYLLHRLCDRVEILTGAAGTVVTLTMAAHDR